jgi:hypothetical protein
MTNQTGKTTKNDIAHSLTKGGLGMIPVIGSLASEIFGLIVTPPLEKRRAEWMNEVAEKLKELETNGQIDFSELKENAQFIDVVLQATTYALKTSEEEKISSFRNALLNTAKGDSPDKTKCQIFLNQIDKFTSWHIRILNLIDGPRDWFERAGKRPPNYMMGSISSMLKEAFPELKDEDELIAIIWNDLGNIGFHRTSGVNTSMTGDGVLSDRTTPLAKEFIEFITIE